MSEETEYKRVLLKVSGEALMGDGQYGIDVATVDRIASEVKDALSLGVEVCMVIGGGNIFRGLSGAADGMDAQCRLYGHAGDNHERLGDAKRA